MKTKFKKFYAYFRPIAIFSFMSIPPLLVFDYATTVGASNLERIMETLLTEAVILVIALYSYEWGKEDGMKK